MAEVTKIDYTNFELQDYNVKDENLITTFDINTLFTTSSCIEFYVLDLNKNVLYSKYDYTNYQVTNDGQSAQTNKVGKFQINPGEDVIGQGFANGEYVAYYNFLNKEIGNYNSTLYISEISSDRQEIRLDSQFITPLNLVEKTEDFIDFREEQNYFVDFYLNFGNNNLIIANNIKIENENTDDPTILIKLYEPLPDQFQIKDEAWVVTSFNEPEAYSVVNRVASSFTTPTPLLQGPNFSIPIKDQVNNSSQNLSYTDIISSAPTSSQDQIDSLLSQSAINISVDYNNFNDFIHFSSAETRIENFYYKVGQIQNFTSQSNALTNVTGSSTSQLIFEKRISNVIKNFDKFEYFMYYSSGSAISYPKSTSTAPYALFPTTSSQVLTWLGSTDETNSNFGGQLLSASNYDNSNPDQLLKAIPEYLREDPSNKPYDLFVDMVAQYYDNIWLYTKNITQKYNADNRLDFGVSKDLVSDAIKDFGVKLYQNNFSNQELYTAFLGITPSGSLFPFPEIAQSYPVPTGMEFVNTLISASNDVISMDDTNKSLYKRIYHNIPYLLKSKGTIAGLRALITSYGIPDTILKISEFGGKDQVNANDWDLYFNNFNYSFEADGTNSIQTPWAVTSTWGAANGKPSTIQLRFKSEKFPPTNLSQSLWKVKDGGLTGELLLDYSGSGLTSGSYDGSIKDPNYKVANLRFIPDSDDSEVSASISLPFYNGDWWSVMLTTNQNDTFNLYAGNKIYNGNDGTSLGYYASASVAGTVDNWTNSITSTFLSSSVNYPSYKHFSGSLQEIRYYNTQISESVFKDYIMNPLSFEGNGVNSAPDQLIFRAALGSELDITTTSSIHPKVTGSYNITQSFTSNSNWTINALQGLKYVKNTEYFFLDQPAVGIKNRTTDKIRSENATIPSGNTLSPIRSLAQNTEASASYTDNINYLEVAFSPQNQINDDIIGQLGYFNVGDYIGDPRQRSSSLQVYPDLENLSEEYFKKYIKQYDLVDFVRLIKFFDNSLFKMIKDFVPARTSLASGLVVKQHLLERNKYPQPQVTQSNVYYTGSIDTAFISGGAAGVFNPFNISYYLDFISGSTTINTNVSASSGDSLSLTTSNTFISGAAGPPITNATNLAFFDSFAPNLYVQLNESGGTLVPFAFNSGSQPGPITNVSGSGTFSGTTTGANTINLLNSASNATNGILFSKFQTQGHIQTSVPIFDSGGSLTNASALDSVASNQLITTLPTQSVSTNVSGSGRLLTPASGDRTHNLGSQNANVVGGTINNIPTITNKAFISASTPIFNSTDGSLVDVTEIDSVTASTITTTFPTQSVVTPVSASGTISFNTQVSTQMRFNLNANTSNVAGNDMTNFQTFKDTGYITTTNPIFSGSSTNSTIASASVSLFGSGLGSFRITGELSDTYTNVSASGTLTGSGTPTNRFNLITSASNATNFNFSQFDAGNTFVSASITNDQDPGEAIYPFDDGSLGGVGIAPITSVTPTKIEVDLSGFSGRQAGSNLFVYNFHILSGSAAGPTTFISQSARTVVSESFTFRSGAITQGTSGPIAFNSSSLRNISGTTFLIHSGSVDGESGTPTNEGRTFISESARILNGVTFNFHTGSVGGGGSTIFISESIIPQSHSRAQVSNIGDDSVIDFASNWSISSVGASTGEEFQLFDAFTGGSNIFSSSSISVVYRNNQLDQVPSPLFPDVTQSFSVTTPSISGSVTRIQNSQDEFYNGELSGSTILVTNGELNEGCEDFKEINPFLADYKVRVYPDTISGFTEGKFLQNDNLPIDGYIQIFYGDEPGSPLAPVLPNTSAG